jgi:methylthioribose-1-phosphate isomerase
VFDRTIWWASEHPDAEVMVVDQTRLPHIEAAVGWSTLEDAVHGISTMQVRGAPLIGVAAVYGIALALRRDPDSLVSACEQLLATRPTAVNLRWALDRARSTLAPLEGPERQLAARNLADLMAAADIDACRRIGEAGVGLLADVHERTGRPVHVLTHCNAGWLACVQWGTATAPIYLAHQQGIPVHVWVSETRPRNQGAALTAWELGHRQVPHTLIVDNAAGHLLQRQMADVVIVGADRIAANGDTANKVGTYLKALAARESNLPFYVAAPSSTVDLGSASGAEIPIEERDPTEVTMCNGSPVAPVTTAARNWGFDITPAELVTGYITEAGILGVDDLGEFGGDVIHA